MKALNKMKSIYMDSGDKKAQSNNLIVEEEKITGKVTFRDYRNYLGFSLGNCGIIL